MKFLLKLLYSHSLESGCSWREDLDSRVHRWRRQGGYGCCLQAFCFGGIINQCYIEKGLLYSSPFLLLAISQIYKSSHLEYLHLVRVGSKDCAQANARRSTFLKTRSPQRTIHSGRFSRGCLVGHFTPHPQHKQPLGMTSFIFFISKDTTPPLS